MKGEQQHVGCCFLSPFDGENTREGEPVLSHSLVRSSLDRRFLPPLTRALSLSLSLDLRVKGGEREQTCDVEGSFSLLNEGHRERGSESLSQSTHAMKKMRVEKGLPCSCCLSLLLLLLSLRSPAGERERERADTPGILEHTSEREREGESEILRRPGLLATTVYAGSSSSSRRREAAAVWEDLDLLSHFLARE